MIVKTGCGTDEALHSTSAEYALSDSGQHAADKKSSRSSEGTFINHVY